MTADNSTILLAVVSVLLILNSINMTGAAGFAKAFYARDRKYGWKASDRPSYHPRYEIPEHHKTSPLPASIDLEPHCPPVYDQGQLGSCTANALAGLFQYLLIKLSKPSFVPSRLMIYWGERALEGTKNEDAGANGDDGITFLLTKGVCPEAMWPYDIAKFAQIPPPTCWAKASQHKIADPVTIDNSNIDEIRSCLASGYPIAFGFVAYPELESQAVADTGILPMPKKNSKTIGGHEVLLIGYDNAKKMFKVRNSWGPGWGLKGYFYMPYAYLTSKQLADDFRSARLAS